MRVAVIVPRFGPGALGGAETLARGFAEEADRRGWTVAVWTTCARSHYTWRNEYPAGCSQQDRVTIRRFPVCQWDASRHRELDSRLERQGHLSAADQYAWLESGAHSPALYEHVSRHAAAFDAVVALPSTVPLVHYAAWTGAERVVVWPCMHDEPYAYMEPIRLLLESVWGVMFLSPEEGDLAVHHLHIRPRHQGVVRGGVSLPPLPADLREASTSFNYLLYAGRLEPGKGLSLLYDYVRRYVDEGNSIRLVVLGQGPLKPPRHRAFEYRGFVTEAEKARVYAAALALCQPSTNESFSITLMESWLAARPVLVHSQCAVTRGHVQRSKGGLWFRTYEEFVGAVEWLQSNPSAADRLGENGREYVLSNFTWENVVTRFECLFERWKAEDA